MKLSAADRLSALPASSLLRLAAPDGATAAVHLHGATVVSWVPSAAAGERLFVSSAAALDGSAPVRGGIPLAFPRFAAGLPSRAASAGAAMPFHGFARNADWRVVSSAPGGAELALDGDAVRAPRARWRAGAAARRAQYSLRRPALFWRAGRRRCGVCGLAARLLAAPGRFL